MDWVDCWAGCDEGWVNEYDDDPINFAPGEEWYPCDICKGEGGWLVCGSCHPDVVTEGMR